MTASHPAIDWTDPARGQAFSAWLSGVTASHALLAQSVRPASADASFRRYFRVDALALGPLAARTYIIMDAPPEKEDCHPFVKVAGLMADAGLSAPRVLAWDEPAGFMLLSDLGAQTMMEVINPPLAVDLIAEPTAAHLELYMEAVDALVRWQLSSRPGVLPPYDEALLSRELALFPEWYVGRHRGITLDAASRATLDNAFAQIKASNLNSLSAARVYVHRDYMPRNLMLADRGEPRLGILDFQDAVYGPITYDIASLMRDAFLTWEEDFVLDITVRYWHHTARALPSTRSCLPCRGGRCVRPGSRSA